MIRCVEASLELHLTKGDSLGSGETDAISNSAVVTMAENTVDKSEMVINEGPFEDALPENEKSKEVKRGNAQDRADMYRMGKVQELRVRYRLFFVKGLPLPSVEKHTDSSRICIERLFWYYDIWIYHDPDCFLGGSFGVSCCQILHPYTIQSDID